MHIAAGKTTLSWSVWDEVRHYFEEPARDYPRRPPRTLDTVRRLNEASKLARNHIQQRTVTGETGRNDPCWCNSGKKFKRCHGA